MTTKSSSSYGASISARRSRARPSPTRSAPSSMSRCKAAVATCTRSSTTIWKRRATCSCSRWIEARSPDGGTAPCGPCSFRPWLLRKFRAGLGFLAPILHALLVVHRALGDDLGKHEIRDVLDFPVLQGGRRIRHALAGLSQIGLLEAVAAAVAVGELVERRHAGSGQAAFDGHDQGGAVEAGFAQIGAVRHLRIHLAAVAGPAVAGLAVALLPEPPGPPPHIPALPRFGRQ